MTEEYDPTKDPANDGFKRVANTPEPPDDGTALSRAAWNAVQSGAPSPFDNPTFKKWGIRIFWVLVLVVGFWIGAEIIAAYKAHKAEVTKIESAPVVLPEAKPPINKRIFKPKSATKEIADKASNTPATGGFGLNPNASTAKTEVEPAVNDLLAVKPKVEYPAMTLPLRPIPPIPPTSPQRSIP